MKLAALAFLAACGSATSVTPVAAKAYRSPAIVDSHVHLALWPVDGELAATGVLFGVDLAAPDRALGQATALHTLVRSGPMLTHEAGYPLDAWGADGYGFGCATEACLTERFDALAARHVRVVKLALDDDGLDPALVPFAVQAAHARHLKVAVHALSEAAAKLGGGAGADVLAHTPVEPLSDETIALWAHRAVISTLAAFGGSDAAIENLRKLRAAGVTVLYGTDLGNLRDAGPSADELALLARAGMSAAEIADAMTVVPLRYWEIAPPASEATYLVLDGDPHTDVRFLLAPREVWSRGKRLR
ncbi:MAG: hypothetical protein IPQ07_12860 [Myxococcales bacterium]|nr:hypothetical protein [Myxococcales bacterium]